MGKWTLGKITFGPFRPFPQFSQSQPQHKACPCLHIEPCDSRCTCIVPVSSRGCSRCCSYGNQSQQRAKAEWIAAAIKEYNAKNQTDNHR